MEPDECDFYELEKDSGYCRYFTGNKLSNGDINHCGNHCSLKESKKLMQDGTEPFTRRRGALRQVRHT